MAISPKSISGFETTVITRSDQADDARAALFERLKGVVAEYGGEVVLTEDWGKKKLMYPIQKETRGHYTYFAYSGRGNVVQEIERNLRIQDSVLRFLSINLSKDFDTEKFKLDRAAALEATKRREQERETRREERAAERGKGYDRGGYDRGGYESRDRGDRGGYGAEGHAE